EAPEAARDDPRRGPEVPADRAEPPALRATQGARAQAVLAERSHRGRAEPDVVPAAGGRNRDRPRARSGPPVRSWRCPRPAAGRVEPPEQRAPRGPRRRP